MEQAGGARDAADVLMRFRLFRPIQKEYNATVIEGTVVSYSPETPFDNIEDAQEYIDLLLQAIEEAQQDVTADIAAATGDQAERRRQALQLVAHNLNKLTLHVSKSRRILNDLRSLRRLLQDERKPQAAEESQSRAAGAA